MEKMNEILPIIIYFLLIVMLIVSIILIIKIISTINKVDQVVDDVNDKVQSLNGFFRVIDFTTDRIVSLSDKVVDLISNGINRLISSKSKKRKEDNNEKEK